MEKGRGPRRYNDQGIPGRTALLDRRLRTRPLCARLVYLPLRTVAPGWGSEKGRGRPNPLTWPRPSLVKAVTSPEVVPCHQILRRSPWEGTGRLCVCAERYSLYKAEFVSPRDAAVPVVNPSRIWDTGEGWRTHLRRPRHGMCPRQGGTGRSGGDGSEECEHCAAASTLRVSRLTWVVWPSPPCG